MHIPSLRDTTIIVQWLILLVLSGLFTAALEQFHLPAALLLGPMVAGILIAVTEGGLSLSQPVFFAGQAIIGCMIAQGMPASILREALHDWPFFLAAVCSVLIASGALGWILTKLRILPGSTAVWGSSPGGASAMTLMSEAYGADMRLVALMQYMRVVIVVLVATIIARMLLPHTGHSMSGESWFPPVHPLGLGETIAVAGFGAVAGRMFHIPAGPLLVPLLAGAILQDTGLMRIDLPPWLLALSYAVVGWSIGLRFTRAILLHAARVLPKVIISIIVLVAVCGGFSIILARVAGVDALTAYLAMSPGGVDSVAIISASSSTVDMPFVMALQTARLLLVILTGPLMARMISRAAGSQHAARDTASF